MQPRTSKGITLTLALLLLTALPPDRPLYPNRVIRGGSHQATFGERMGVSEPLSRLIAALVHVCPQS